MASQSWSNLADDFRSGRNMRYTSSVHFINRACAYAGTLYMHVCKHLTRWHVVTTCFHVNACRAIMQWITSMGRKLLTGSINLINTPFPGEFERVESTSDEGQGRESESSDCSSCRVQRFSPFASSFRVLLPTVLGLQIWLFRLYSRVQG